MPGGDRHLRVVRRGPPPGPLGEAPRRDFSRAETVALLQGGYYAATGVWPYLSLESFEAVTGPKAEGWLVKTVGGLVGVIGGVLAAAGARRRVTPEIAWLGAGSAAVLAGIDVWYVARRRIPPVYLLDAAAEALLSAGWASAARELEEDGEPDEADDGWPAGPRGRSARGRRRGG
ncbi:MAG TPA: hypothetical protein VF746_06680 [Longimicrobium sp.]|jgi:hypothetical protein